VSRSSCTGTAPAGHNLELCGSGASQKTPAFILPNRSWPLTRTPASCLAALPDERTLLVIDNCEHVLDAAAAVVAEVPPIRWPW
jgi:hypothetical protein